MCIVLCFDKKNFACKVRWQCRRAAAASSSHLITPLMKYEIDFLTNATASTTI